MTAHLTRVRQRMTIHAHRKVRGLLEGEYASHHSGRSMDFNDLREYVRGDDVKDLDWKASARTRTLLVRRYAAVRKHTVLVAVSSGRSMAAQGDIDSSKAEVAITVAGVLGYLAVRHGDMVSVVHGDSAGVHQFPPKAGLLPLERALAAIHDSAQVSAAPSDLARVLSFIAARVRRRTILLVVTDLDGDDARHGPAPEVVELLRRLAVQHEVLLVGIGDLDPTVARSRLDHDLVDIDSRMQVPSFARLDPSLRQQYADTVAATVTAWRRALDGLGIPFDHVQGHDQAITTVFRLLQRHRRARRR